MRKKVAILLLASLLLVPTSVFATSPNEAPPPVVEDALFVPFTQSAVILNPPLDPVEGVVPFSNIVEVVFVCRQHTTGSPPRDLVISTPGSFTIPGRGTMGFPSGWSANFRGWVDSAGTLWTPGTVARWDRATSGTLTMTASWTLNVRGLDCDEYED